MTESSRDTTPSAQGRVAPVAEPYQAATYADGVWTVSVSPEWVFAYGRWVIPEAEGYIHYDQTDDDPNGPLRPGDRIVWWCNGQKLAEAEIVRDEEWQWVVGNRAAWVRRL